ncbi:MULTISPECIES: hypothetical protein [Pelagibacterium]|uniref:DUF4268 domain-containing protein n=1 Tax=Pelagibacterium luteolum TaxID=440168 RepID=A0A1G7WPH7_9HYPH|nr:MULTISPECIES: hypothetical protein [Pelagibacterium]SDG73784.1 hypothetical protein SAMN04487974_10730 [Pelagibacterium luteolum]
MQSLVLNEDDFEQGEWLHRSSLASTETGRNEKWLQELLFVRPELLPIADISPGSAGYVPVCRELSLPKEGGTVFLDIFGVTAEGKLVLVECKLWRNPQARREVVAQILEYASLLRRWSYADLNARLKSSLGLTGPNPLFEIAQKAFPQLDEALFVDRVTHSLKAGDFNLVIAGDGIRSDIDAIAAHLNNSSGLSSKLALVEFQLWEGSDGKTMVVPSVPLRTEVIKHRVIVAQDGYPIHLEPDGDGSGQDEGDIGDPERSLLWEQQRAFWQRFIDEAVFDHADQPKPRHGGAGWVKLAMPPPINSMTVYKLSDGSAGILFRLRGEEGEAAYAAIQNASEALEEQLGMPMYLEAEKANPFQGCVRVRYPGVAQEDDVLRAWFLASANAMVSTFRPFCSQWLGANNLEKT